MSAPAASSASEGGLVTGIRPHNDRGSLLSRLDPTRSLLACLLVALAALAGGACGQSNPYAPVEGSGIAGRVVMVDAAKPGAGDPSPLPGVKVQIADMKTAEYITEVKTDAEGGFAFGVAPGRYTVKVTLAAGRGLATPAIVTVRRGKVTPVTLGVEPPLPSTSP